MPTILEVALGWLALNVVVVLLFNAVRHRDPDALPPPERPLDMTGLRGGK